MKPGKLDRLEQVQVHSRAEWRAWLRKHHTRKEGIWLVTYKKVVPDHYVDYDSIVEEALCFGWIDSLPRKLDAERKMLYVSPRKRKSVWSRLNKARVATLIAGKRMTPAGSKVIEAAKADGSWNALDAIEAMEIPQDLQRALRANNAARKHFDSFPPGARKQIIGWVLGARTHATRERRVALSVSMAAQGLRANEQGVRTKRPSA